MNIPMHRFKYTKLTKEQIDQKLKATEAGPKCVSELSDVLAGKSLKIVTDNGPVLNYYFKNKNTADARRRQWSRRRSGIRRADAEADGLLLSHDSRKPEGL